MDDTNTQQVRDFNQETAFSLSRKDSNNLEDYRIFWVDEQINKSGDCQKTLTALEAITKSINISNNIENSLSEIDALADDSIIFFIMSGSLAQTYLHRISSSRISWIYIFCYEKTSHETSLSDRQTKIRGIFNLTDELIKTLSTDIRLYCERWLFDEKSFWHEDNQSYTFYHLINSIIANLPSTKEARQEFIDECRLYYRNNKVMLKKIQEFEDYYTPDQVIKYYTKDNCFHQIVNRALRTRDIDLMCKCRMFISDLSVTLNKRFHDHDEIMASLLNPKKRISVVYRGQYLSEDELKKLCTTLHDIFQPFFVNTFTSASRDRDVALKFICYGESSRPNMIPVLFEINLDNRTKVDSSPWSYVDISEQSDRPEEEEVLLEFGIKLLVRSITGVDDGSAYVTITCGSLSFSNPALFMRVNTFTVCEHIRKEPAENHAELINLIREISNSGLSSLDFELLWQALYERKETVLVCMQRFFELTGDEDLLNKGVKEYKKVLIDQIKNMPDMDRCSFIINILNTSYRKMLFIYEIIIKLLYEQHEFSNCSHDDLAKLFQYIGFAYDLEGRWNFHNCVNQLSWENALQCYEKAYYHERKSIKYFNEDKAGLQKRMLTKLLSAGSNNTFESELKTTIAKNVDFYYTNNNTLMRMWQIIRSLDDRQRQQNGILKILSYYLVERAHTIPIFTSHILIPLLVQRLSPTFHNNQFQELNENEQDPNILKLNLVSQYKQYIFEWHMLNKLNTIIKNYNKQINTIRNISLLSDKYQQQLNMAITLCMLLLSQGTIKNIRCDTEANQKLIFFSDYDFKIYGHCTFDAIEYYLKNL